MTTDRVQISEELDSRLQATGMGFEDARAGLASAGPMPTEGIDPSSIAAAEQSQQHTEELLKKGKSTSDKGRDFVRDGKEQDGKSGKDIDSTDADPDKALKDGRPVTEASADAAHPSSPSNGATTNPLGGMSGQGMPQMGMPSYNPASLPTPPLANQFDMNNAPNNGALRTAARSGMQDGSLPGSRGGAHPINLNGADTEFQKRVLEAVDARVNAQPPIPYAWGGGHGATPGPSQGTRDGGWADQCGDFNKIGLDCSGFYRDIIATATGQDIAAGTSESLWAAGTPVSGTPMIGDAAFPEGAGRPPKHIQIYIGNGQVAEAQKSGTFLMISDMRPGTEFRRFVS
ncbi:peptidoglycan endopeptidase [Mycobacteroides abscessus]|uniref:Peptidoglycan endopeptidase n=1 Tax=Mycobacteroides abscessus TaxID=36809 RepID=A0ABD7HM16_9MYCO|nr:NlpC/P60 family protein [Mycobacteroides abscessus]RIT36870.1 peptidoglycan endopeptidase [Mycobacteroides abscessus]